MEHPLIHRDPKVMVGKPVIRGRRITVEHVLRQMAAGATWADMRADYDLTDEQLRAAIEYAADQLSDMKAKAAA